MSGEYKLTAERLVELFGKESVEMLLASGAPEAPVVSPRTLGEAAEVLRFASREKLNVLPVGAGEHLYSGGPLGPFQIFISTRRLRRLVEYSTEDMTLVVEAGLTLHELEALVEPHGQRLAPDPWPGKAATLGGAVAANRAGLNRLRWGTPRDIVLGMRVLHADGRSSKTGGKVVKNVAGYDLGKLYVGSCGSLALIAEVNVRLASRPPESTVVIATLDRARAETVLLELHRSALVPSSLLLVAGEVSPELPIPPGQVALVARFEGGPRAVRWQAWECLRIAGGSELVPERGRATYESLRSFSEPVAGAMLLRILSMPVAACSVLACLESMRGASLAFVAQFGVGSSHARLRPESEKRAVPSNEIEGLRGRLGAIGARLTIEQVAPLPPFTHRPATLAGGLKAVFDPEGRLRAAPLLEES